MIILGSVLILSACQKSLGVRESAAGADFVQLQGAELVLHSPLLVPAGNARVYVQGGRAGAGFDQYKPHCAFEIQRVDHSGFTIKPDTFRITLVQGSLQSVVMLEPIKVAGLHLAALYDRGGSAYHEGYHFWLASERQPEVRRMTCYGTYAEPPDLQPPTLQEIRGALGGIAELRR
jgi:hypothetical protein